MKSRFLKLVAEWYTQKEAADMLSISVKTVIAGQATSGKSRASVPGPA